MVCAVVLVGVSIGQFAAKQEFELLPTVDANSMTLNIDIPVNVGQDARKDAIERIMDEVILTPHFQSYFIFEGEILIVYTEPDERADGMEIFEIHTELEQRMDDVQEEIGIEDLRIVTAVMGIGPPSEEYDVVVELRGNSLTDLESAAGDLEEFMNSQSGVVEVRNSMVDEQVRSIDVQLQDDKLQEHSINPLVAAGAVNAVFSDQEIGSIVIREDGVSDDVIVAYNDESKQSIDDVKEIAVGVTSTFPPEIVSVDSVAEVQEISKPQSIQRLNQLRLVALKAKVEEGADTQIIEDDIDAYLDENLAEYNLEPTEVAYGGQLASLYENYSNLMLVFIIAVIAVYLILVFQFNSYVQPGLIMFTVPLALIGVFPAIWAIGSTLNMVSGLGIIALVGIVVNDAIVFVDYFNRLRREHASSLITAIVETGRARFKPILSTSITTIFGVLPLTVMDPFWRGLGTSLIVGLICSTVGTLVVFPILLSWNDAIGKAVVKCIKKKFR